MLKTTNRGPQKLPRSLYVRIGRLVLASSHYVPETHKDVVRENRKRRVEDHHVVCREGGQNGGLQQVEETFINGDRSRIIQLVGLDASRHRGNVSVQTFFPFQVVVGSKARTAP